MVVHRGDLLWSNGAHMSSAPLVAETHYYKKPGFFSGLWSGIKNTFTGRSQAQHRPELYHQHPELHHHAEHYYEHPEHFHHHHESYPSHSQEGLMSGKKDEGLMWETPKKWWWQTTHSAPVKAATEAGSAAMEKGKEMIGKTQQAAKDIATKTVPTTKRWFRGGAGGGFVSKVMKGVKIAGTAHLVYSAMDNSHYLMAGDYAKFGRVVGNDTLRGLAIGGVIATVCSIMPIIGTVVTAGALAAPAMYAYMYEGFEKRFWRSVSISVAGTLAASLTMLMTGFPILAGCAAGFWSYVARSAFM